MKRIAIIGSAHLGQQIAHHIHTDTEDKVVAFFDDFQPKGTIIDSIPVIGGTNDILEEYSKNIIMIFFSINSFIPRVM